MPNTYIRNDTDHPLHIAWTSGVPLFFQNNLQPGETFTKYGSPSWLFSIEIRRTDGDPFSGEEAGEKAKTIGLACAAGTGSVLLGAASALGAFRGWRAPAGAGMVGARAMFGMACAGGQAFAAESSGFVLRVGNVVVGFVDKHLVVRFENGSYRIFDEDSQAYL